MDTLVELSHTIEEGMVTYRGLPAPQMCDFLSREAARAHYGHDTGLVIQEIQMVGNTGTYLDSPFHRFEDGCDLADLELRQVANIPGVVVTPPADVRAIGEDAFRSVDVSGKAVLVATGWSRHFGTEQYFEGHPFLTAGAATSLRDRGATLVGIDSLNIDDTNDGVRPVHTTLLGANIPIVEHLTNLERLPKAGFRFTAAPAKVKGFGTFPVRAYASLSRP